jgi:hypothetical protein
MFFRKFVYHPDAEEGLTELKRRGDEVFAELMRQIGIILETWVPDDETEPQLVVPFLDVFLVFTVSDADKSLLVLAAVEHQPEG